MTKSILAIHGAFSSPIVFNYLESQLCDLDWNYLNYEKMFNNINAIIDQTRAAYTGGQPKHLVGHSMGGLIALALENEPWVRSVTTVATPLNGLEIKPMMSMWSRSNFLQDIAKGGDFIRGIQRQRFTKPVQHLVSLSGFSPWIYEANDGVISLASQRAWTVGKSHDVDANHGEIMQHPRTVSLIKSWIEEQNYVEK